MPNDSFSDRLKVVIALQNKDMQLIQLMRSKTGQQAELERIRSLRDDLHHQVVLKESEIIEIKKQVRIIEGDIAELSAKIQKLEAQQNSVRKVEEFNALTHEISALEREKAAKEQRLSDHYDRLGTEEDLLKSLKSSYTSTKDNSGEIENEIKERIILINQEGSGLMSDRQTLAEKADPELMKIYEKLLRNKRDRVIVPIENRCCSGCHILVTAQYENIVRKGDKVIFCEHCSRIHYWHDSIQQAFSNASIELDSSVKKRKRAAPIKL
ncbi:MAG: zinc ribbon domain-containing protein [Chlamydia sp.]